jgi:DNA-binding NtrC family response regulator
VLTQEIDLMESAPITKNSPALEVLVVDDEPLIRWSVTETLHDCGYHVTQAMDAVTARAAVRDQGQFDVVLLDYRLPDSEDLRLLAGIRKHMPEAKVILMTAFGTPEVVRHALDLGAYRVVNKPFEMNDLAALVAQAAASPAAH